MKTKLTLQQANALIERADSLFRRAALAWERGNNSGNDIAHKRGDQQCDRLRRQAEELIAPLGINCDYPGLYPSFTVNGFSYHTTESAVSAALETPPETMNDDHDRPCTEIRVLPVGGGGNALVGLESYKQEMKFRRERNRELGDAARFDLPTWESLSVYRRAGEGVKEGGK